MASKHKHSRSKETKRLSLVHATGVVSLLYKETPSLPTTNTPSLSGRRKWNLVCSSHPSEWTRPVRMDTMRLPPGFRFHPTDEELVEQYLKRKVFCCPLPSFVIPVVELSKFDPWDLPGSGEKKYFFNFREVKYRHGDRSNRTGASGFWKATGKDKQVVASKGGHVLGVKKVLVFYRGKPSNRSRTDWVMHEYRLGGVAGAVAGRLSLQAKASACNNLKLPMEDWVLCRIFQKKRATGVDEGDQAIRPRRALEDGGEDHVSGLSCVTDEKLDGLSSEDECCSSR